MATRAVRLTPAAPGAIGIIQLDGADAASITETVLRRTAPIDARPAHGTFHDANGVIDDGVVVRLADDVVLLMPHGGPRVMNRLARALAEAGADVDDDRALAPFPEARDDLEARMLHVLARAVSPRAVDLLLDQPRRHAAHLARHQGPPSAEDRARSARLDRLLSPPLVVLAGAPNIGKSTLTNALAGRARSIVYDDAGTTRDTTGGAIDLGGVVVEWLDTPGLRRTDDPIEAESIRRAHGVIERATYLIIASTSDVSFPELARPADLRLGLQADRGAVMDADLSVSAVTGAGLTDLVARVRDDLVPPADLAHPGPWWFAVASDPPS